MKGGKDEHAGTNLRPARFVSQGGVELEQPFEIQQQGIMGGNIILTWNLNAMFHAL